MAIPFSMIFSGYYAGASFVDPGIEFHVTNEIGAALMLRRRFGANSFALGLGKLKSDIIFRRGIGNTNLGDGKISTTDLGNFYVATYRHAIPQGSILVSYAALRDRLTFSGRTVIGFDMDQPLFDRTEARMDVDKRYFSVGYEFSF